MRRMATLPMPVEKAPELYSAWDNVKMMVSMLPYMAALRKWAGLTIKDLTGRFKSRLIRDGLQFWPQEFSVMALMVTIAWMHNKTAGYTIGGSMPLMRAVEKRYTGLGGAIAYKSRVAKILVEGDRAVGVRVEGGQEHRADYIISAADGYATIFDMLDGKYVDDTVRGYYTNLPIFTPILYVAVGVNRTFGDLPQMISGLTIGLEKPVLIGGTETGRLHARINNFDPTMTPAGKSVITCMIDADYYYWKKLKAEPARYKEEKENVAATVLGVLDRRFPGLAKQVEMTDVATPVTFERYTGNWQGCYEGFLSTPKTQMLRMKKTLPGLESFYMVGQWVSPGGGLPSGVMTGRHVVQVLCKRDGGKFTTSLPA
jgi:phytoene dehydrogenase-like protein